MQHSSMVKAKNSGVSLPGFRFWFHHLLAVKTWPDGLTSLCCGFCTLKMEAVIAPTHRFVLTIKEFDLCKSLKIMASTWHSKH